MWTDEKIFSIGDLENFEDYDKFIKADYEGNYTERLLHVEEMIKRLTAERNVLADEKPHGKR
jgi:hypothetical protein